jgi:YNFM family putative membrane transporter
MKRRVLVPLFLINFIVYFIGAGLLPLLPLYAARFGVSATGSGLHIAFLFVTITVGTMLTGRLTHYFSTRSLFLVTGLLGIPMLALIGRSTAFWPVVMLTGAIWFLAGVGTALVNIEAGRHATRNKRGRSFGLLFIALPAASLIAGLTAGRLVEWQSYRVLFDMLAIFWSAWPFLAFLRPNEKPEPRPAQVVATRATGRGRPALGTLFYILVATTLLSAITYYLTRLGTTFSLSSLGFSPTAIAGTSAVGGLTAIPATYLIGILSDRLSRKNIVILGSLFAVGATVIISTAGELWHFWLATGILYMSRSINGAVGPALATDLLASEKRDQGLAYLSAGNWIAGIIGSAIAGIGMDSLGQTNLYLLAAGLAALAALLMALLPVFQHLPVVARLQPAPGK